jgi:hypothetical protein
MSLSTSSSAQRREKKKSDGEDDDVKAKEKKKYEIRPFSRRSRVVPFVQCSPALSHSQRLLIPTERIHCVLRLCFPSSRPPCGFFLCV